MESIRELSWRYSTSKQLATQQVRGHRPKNLDSLCVPNSSDHRDPVPRRYLQVTNTVICRKRYDKLGIFITSNEAKLLYYGLDDMLTTAFYYVYSGHCRYSRSRGSNFEALDLGNLRDLRLDRRER